MPLARKLRSLGESLSPDPMRVKEGRICRSKPPDPRALFQSLWPSVFLANQLLTNPHQRKQTPHLTWAENSMSPLSLDCLLEQAAHCWIHTDQSQGSCCLRSKVHFASLSHLWPTRHSGRSTGRLPSPVACPPSLGWEVGGILLSLTVMALALSLSPHPHPGDLANQFGSVSCYKSGI